MNNKLYGVKQAMMVSGLLLACFLALHLCFNLTVLCGEAIYNDAFRYMNTHPVLQLAVTLFGLGFIVHILLAFFISAKGFYATPEKDRGEKRNWLNMLIPGIIVLGFVAMHLANFWQKTRLQLLFGGTGEESPYLLVANLFRQPFYVAIYLIWIAALWYHLSYGFWTLLQSIPSRKKEAPGRFRVLKWAAIGFSTVIAVGFAVIPLWFGLGFDK